MNPLILFRYLHSNPISVIESPNLVFLESLTSLSLDWDSFQCRPQPPTQGWTAFSLTEPPAVQSLPNCTESSAPLPTTIDPTLPKICVWYAVHMQTCDSTTIRFNDVWDSYHEVMYCCTKYSSSSTTDLHHLSCCPPLMQNCLRMLRVPSPICKANTNIVFI